MRLLRRLVLLSSLTCLSLALTACGDPVDPAEGEGEGEGGADVPADVQAIFDASCATAGCHVSVFPVLKSGEAGAKTIGVASRTCAPQEVVDAGDPDNSCLVVRISGSDKGTQMPRGAPPLAQADIDTIRNWIAGLSD